jgi:hypothetical protein
MKQAAKFGVLLLTFLMGGAPVLACALPSAALTEQEKACCRRMARQCGGQQQMPRSHSCCKAISPPAQIAIAQPSYKLVHHVQPFGLDQPPIQVAGFPRHGLATLAMLDHSPPVAPPSSADILRI